MEAPHDLGQVSTMQREGETRAVGSTVRMVSRHRKVRTSTASFDSQQGYGISFGFHKTVVGLDGMTSCTKCHGTGASINRPHSSMGDR